MTTALELLDRAVSIAPAPVRGATRMAAAATGDILHALDPLELAGDERTDDPLERRDPAYIRDTLPAIGLMSRVWFRGEVHGLEHIPADGPVLLVGNHSGGTLIADTFVFAHAFYEHLGAGRRFHQLAHDLVFDLPGIREILIRYGTVPASPENMARALALDAALLVYPGGDHETYRPSWESSEVDFAGRTGFVRLALEHDVPIVPVVAIGGQETALFLGQGSSLARRMHLDRLLRLKVVPAQIGPPFGVTILDLPGRVPLPAKITVQVLEPIDLRERLGERPDVADGYDLVTGIMQESLDELSDERTIPVVG